jgi:hypothetical protein
VVKVLERQQQGIAAAAAVVRLWVVVVQGQLQDHRGSSRWRRQVAVEVEVVLLMRIATGMVPLTGSRWLHHRSSLHLWVVVVAGVAVAVGGCGARCQCSERATRLTALQYRRRHDDHNQHHHRNRRRISCSRLVMMGRWMPYRCTALHLRMARCWIWGAWAPHHVIPQQLRPV